MTRLHGHHALVTGAGTGIGAAIARALDAEGATLTLVGRRRAPLEAVAHDLAGALAVPGDVTRREEVDAAFEMAHAAHGPVTLLVNNAGMARSLPFAKLSVGDWREIIDVNCNALFHCCQAALPDLLKAEAGRIVTIASTAGLKGYAYSAPYVAAKHGAIGLTRALAAEFAKTDLTINAVCPGFTDTDMVGETVERLSGKTGRDAEEIRADIAAFNPQGRLLDPAEIASAVIWLCLPENRSITGQAIAVAGGEVM
ncbi:MAG: SDR family NAD(P)-dependent oxidoreductase [Sphingomonadaceae bacterium]|nr:SDR family NAD(P)-dependent oxidoreductase [Sphingomonadaceae bacterium]